MKIKENKTRISLWIQGKRFSKIEVNKLFITNGYSKDNKNFWTIYTFNEIDSGLDLLQSYLLKRKINISSKEQKYIQALYIKLTN